MRRTVVILTLILLTFLAIPAIAQAPSLAVPDINLNIGNSHGPQDLSSSLQIILILTVLSLAPAIIILLTSFTRIAIVLAFTRNALGTQQIPPNAVLIGLALFLTSFTMAPVWKQIDSTALRPYMAHHISYDIAMQRAILPVRAFMFNQTRESDLAVFVNLAKIPRPRTRVDIPTYVLIPAFVIGELKTAFTMGFLIFIPFVIIDMVVATVLMSMGMMMMPPMMISLPCKLMLFVLIEGWQRQNCFTRCRHSADN
ncbi:MAG TPA: flagellar type III secretion system pore protein FliP, partial [Armatimonadota bacterium]|nr:flagellar type III secretion system pore protein FliP [Armatimonadota bacterium]